MLWRRAKVLTVDSEQIERDKRRGRFLGQLGHPRRGRMQTELQRVEVEPFGSGNHDLAVEHAPGR